MLRIKLGARRYVGESADMFLPRTHAGWDPTLTEDQIYEAARGWWKLAERAENEKYAVIVAGGEVRLVVAIDEWATRARDGRRGFSGRILQPGDEVRDRLVGRPDPVSRGSQNPIAYLADEADLGYCHCGCGTRTRGEWVAGHDQNALRQMIEVNFQGSTGRFLAWCREQGLRVA